jgi:hypothetical protein
VLQGRLDRFGRHYVLTAVLADAASAEAVARLREDSEAEDELLAAADRLGDRVAQALGVGPNSPAPAAFTGSAPGPAPDRFHLNFKFGHNVQEMKGFSFDAFALNFEIEGAYYLRPFLLAWLEAGLKLGRGESDDGKSNFRLVPVAAGLKYVLRPHATLRPYAGLGFGLGVLSQLVEAERRVGLHYTGVLGLSWLPWRRVGFNIETSVNFDDLWITQGSTVLFTYSTNFGVLALF